MTPSQAAHIIGCSPQQVRTLIRKGTIVASKLLQDPTVTGYPYTWTITPAEAIRIRDRVSGGWPRGKSRKGAN